MSIPSLRPCMCASAGLVGMGIRFGLNLSIIGILVHWCIDRVWSSEVGPSNSTRDYVVELQSTNPNTLVKIVVERNTNPSLPTRVFQRIYGPFPGQVLVAIGLDSNNGIHPLAYTLVEAESKSSWCWDGVGKAYKDLLWRATSATNVRDFEKCMLELKTMNPKAHEWLNNIPAKHWARSHFLGRSKSNLFLNNICEVFNGKIVKGRDKPVITLLEYIREYCMKRIMNIQGVIDKCVGPLTPTATKIMESIKKEAHLMKV
ncbi:hypothetical protein Tco_1326654 [Tanacetum coccineum]